MTIDQTLAATAVQSWKMHLERAEKLFFGLSDAELLNPIAPGRNRLVYLFGHLLVVHDAMLPILDIGARRRPELDAPFLVEADGNVPDLPTGADLRRMWTDVHAVLNAGIDGFAPADWVAKHTLVSADDFAANPLRNRLAVLLNRTGHLAGHYAQALLARRS
jgi:hypothetical protein